MPIERRAALQFIPTVTIPLVDSLGKAVATRAFSRYKFGDTAIARQYGKDLARFAATHYPEVVLYAPRIAVLTSDYQQTPSSSTVLTETFTEELNRIRSEHSGQNTPAKLVRVEKKYSDEEVIKEHYGMRRVRRKSYAYIDPHEVEGHAILFVDDIRVTGAQEQRIKALLDPIQTTSIHYLYALMLGKEAAAESPSLEYFLMHAFVNNLQTLSTLAQSPDFFINRRVCKYFLSQSNQGEIQKFLSTQTDKFLRDIYLSSLADELNQYPDYQVAWTALEEEIRKREAKQSA